MAKEDRASKRPILARTAPVALLCLLAILSWPAPAPGAERELYDVRVFTRIPSPGQPEPIAIGPPHARVYVGTNQQANGDTEAPSKVFAYSRRGRLVRSYEIAGQNLAEPHGLQGLLFDGRGRLYALDRSANARVIRIDPRSGRQRTWATFADVPPCWRAAGAECSATIADAHAEPDYAAFGPDGRMYVTDIEQALIWRIPRGGGRARVWFTDPALESVFGPNGIQFTKDRRTLLLAVTLNGPVTGRPISGSLYRIRLGPGGRPGPLELFWPSRNLDFPDGFAISRSGHVYVALAGNSGLAVISPTGEEIARVPPTPFANSEYEIPFDGPGSVAFLGRRVLVTNHSPLAGNPGSWAVLDVYVGRRGLPLNRPR